MQILSSMKKAILSDYLEDAIADEVLTHEQAFNIAHEMLVTNYITASNNQYKMTNEFIKYTIHALLSSMLDDFYQPSFPKDDVLEQTELLQILAQVILKE